MNIYPKISFGISHLKKGKEKEIFVMVDEYDVMEKSRKSCDWFKRALQLSSIGNGVQLRSRMMHRYVGVNLCIYKDLPS